jgi:hypothetical protein
MEKNHIDRLRHLLHAYMENNISEAEFDELVLLIPKTGEDEALDAAIDQAWNELDQHIIIGVNSERIYDQILADPRLSSNKAISKKYGIRHIWPVIAGAAALICMGIFLYIQQRQNDKNISDLTIVQSTKRSPSIALGSKRALLTLSNGEQIMLDSISEKMLSQQLGTPVKKSQGRLFYINDATDEADMNPPQRNTISTPLGSEFELLLPDGTKVWLNAGSSITYPTRFSGTYRAIKLLGEAYFDVAKNKDQPFVVDANGTQIKVLGTQFNVHAYQNEETVKTTLVAGAILVKSKKLNPGQQAITFPASEKVTISTVDLQEATAWRQGYFYFADEKLPTVMNTLARWYDIEVSYSGDLHNKTFGGTISRYEDVNKLLKAIELTGSVHFQINGRRVMVSP